MHLEKQMKTLSTKCVDFVIACPGRLLDLLKRGKLNLSQVK
jgi:superfamily II DNA/RNA helicase